MANTNPGTSDEIRIYKQGQVQQEDRRQARSQRTHWGPKKKKKKKRNNNTSRQTNLSSQPRTMEHLQLLRLFLLCLLALQRCPAIPLGSQCVDESFCPYSLQDYYGQLVNLPSRINERSIATWSYVENIDLNRVPQVIHEASCHTGHSCRGLDSTFGLETIPVSLRMPVLKKNPSCFPTASYSLDFELITIACICAISRHS